MSPVSPSSYYIAGGTMPAEAESYVERQADHDLLRALLDGHYCYVLNARQMGKSSLCVRTMKALRKEGRQTVFVDLTRIGGKNVSAEQWYAALSLEIGRGLGLQTQFREYWKQHTEFAPMQRLFGSLREAVLDWVESPIVIFLDEIDATRSLPFDTDEFFAGIRECYNRRVHDTEFEQLTFCLLGVAVPSDLIQDTRTTPFNIGERIDLRDFTLEEALQLASGLGDKGDELVRRVHYWTSGHPYLTQTLCRALADGGAGQGAAGVDRYVAQELLDPAARESNINLADVGNRVLNGIGEEGDPDEFRARILTAYGRAKAGKERLPDDESNRVSAVLKLSGLMRPVGGTLEVRNRIYRQVFDRGWIHENMPKQEMARLRRAYRRGLVLAGSILGSVLAVVGGLGYAALAEAGQADLNMKAAQRNAVKAQSSAETANKNAREARASERRIAALLKERDSALRAAKLASERERKARLTADARAMDAIDAKALADKSAAIAKTRTAEAERFSFEAYVLTLDSAEDAIKKAELGKALRILEALERQPQKGWELSYLQWRLHQVGHFVQAHAARLMGLRFVSKDCLATLGNDGTLALWDSRDGKLLKRFPVPVGSRYVEPLPGGKQAILAGIDGSLRLIDLETGRLGWRVPGEFELRNPCSLSPNGRLLATTSGKDQGLVNIYAAQTGQVVKRISLSRQYTEAMAWSPNGARFAISGGKHIVLFDSKTWRELGRFSTDVSPDERECDSLEFASDGESLIGGTGLSSVYRYDLRTGQRTMLVSGSSRFMLGLHRLPNNRGWASSSMDGRLRFWSHDFSSSTAERIHPHLIRNSVLSPDGARVATTGDDGGFYLWSVPSGSEKGVAPAISVLKLPVEHSYIRNLAASPDGSLLAIRVNGLTNEITRNKFFMVRTSDWKILWSKATPGTRSDLPLFTPDGKRVLIGDPTTHRTLVFRASDGMPLAELPLCNPLAFSADGQLAAFNKEADKPIYDGRNESTLVITDGATFTPVRSRKLGDSRIQAAAFSPNGKEVAVTLQSREADVLDLSTLRPRLVLHGHASWMSDLLYSRDGSKLFTTGWDASTRIWSTADGRELRALVGSGEFGPSVQIELLESERRVAVRSIDGLQVWDPATGKLLVSIPCGSSVGLAQIGSCLYVAGRQGDVLKLPAPATLARPSAAHLKP